jgi:hypothetical protein
MFITARRAKKDKDVSTKKDARKSIGSHPYHFETQNTNSISSQGSDIKLNATL